MVVEGTIKASKKGMQPASLANSDEYDSNENHLEHNPKHAADT